MTDIQDTKPAYLCWSWWEISNKTWREGQISPHVFFKCQIALSHIFYLYQQPLSWPSWVCCRPLSSCGSLHSGSQAMQGMPLDRGKEGCIYIFFMSRRVLFMKASKLWKISNILLNTKYQSYFRYIVQLYLNIHYTYILNVHCTI